MLLANWTGQDGYNMLISGFVLGTVIFALFLYLAIVSFKNVKQIKKFKKTSDKYYEDKYATVVIYLIEALTTFFYVAELIIWIAAMVFISKYRSLDVEGTENKYNNQANGLGIAADVMFLCVAILVICYMIVSSLWTSSLIVVVNEETLITTNAIAPRSAVTVSRVLKSPHMFKITYKDPDMKSNLKEARLRYSKGMEAFLTKNGFYAGGNND